MADSKKYDGSQWEHSLRKLTTATDILTALPADLYADGNNATVGLVGNMQQSGTPTPQNPIQPSETGERTGNLFDGRLQQGFYAYSNGVYTYGTNYVCTYLIPCEAETTYTFNLSRHNGSKNYGFVFFDENQSHIGADYSSEQTITDEVTYTATSPQNSAYLAINIAYATGEGGIDINSIKNFMLNSGSTVLPYEPYGYKIPISSANTTTPVYLGEVETTRKIKKLVLTGEENWQESSRSGGYRFALGIQSALQSDTTVGAKSYCSHFKLVGTGQTYALNNAYTISGTSELLMTLGVTERLADFKSYLAQQYSAGIPVTIWYVLATPETAVVNEPIRKIGDYADTVSGISIPTTTGADIFDVETTLKPSEVSLSYTGWHDASVKEKSENLFDVSTANIGVAWNMDLNNNRATVFLSCEPDTDYCFSSQTTGLDLLFICEKANSSSTTAIDNTGRTYSSPISFTTTSETHCIAVQFNKTNISMQDIDNLNTMLNTGSTALPYEPYWK